MVRNTSNIAHHCSLFPASSPTVLLYSYRSATPTGNPRTRNARYFTSLSRICCIANYVSHCDKISLTFRKPGSVSIIYRHAEGSKAQMSFTATCFGYAFICN